MKTSNKEIRLELETSRSEKTIKTRTQALESGDYYYYSGKPCIHGHLDVRISLSGNCYTCTEIIRDKQKFQKKNFFNSSPSPTRVYQTEYMLLYEYFKNHLESESDYIERCELFEKHELEIEPEKEQISTQNFLVDGFLNGRGKYEGLNKTNPVLYKNLYLRFQKKWNLLAEIYPKLSKKEGEEQSRQDIVQVYILLKRFMNTVGYYKYKKQMAK